MKHSNLNRLQKPTNIKQMNKVQNIRIQALITQPINVVVAQQNVFAKQKIPYSPLDNSTGNRG